MLISGSHQGLEARMLGSDLAAAAERSYCGK